MRIMNLKAIHSKELVRSALKTMPYMIMVCLFVSCLWPYAGDEPFDMKSVIKRLSFSTLAGGLLVISCVLGWMKDRNVLSKRMMTLFVFLTIILLFLVAQGVTFCDMLSFIAFSLLLFSLYRCRIFCENIDGFVSVCLLGSGAFCVLVVLAQLTFKKSYAEICFDSVTEWCVPVVVSYAIVANLLFQEKRNRYIFLYLCIMCVIVVVIAFVGSRNSLLSICVVSIIRFKKTYKIAALLFVLIFLMVTAKCEKQESSLGRIFISTTSLSMLESSKEILLGRGAYSFENEYMLFQERKLRKMDFATRQRADEIAHPLNEYIYMAVNFGMLFLIAFLCLLVLFVFCHPNDMHRDILISIMILSLFSYPLAYPIVWSIVAWCLSCDGDTQGLDGHKGLNKNIAILFVCLGCFLIVNSYRLARAYGLWVKSYNSFLIGNRSKAMALYALLGKEMGETPYFTFNHASLLLYSGEGKKALSVMKTCKRSNYETSMLMGDIYVSLHDYHRAHEYYDLAYGMCPNRFTPLYKKYLIYKKRNDKIRKKQMCEKILSKPIKIESKNVNEILKSVKQEIRVEE